MPSFRPLPPLSATARRRPRAGRPAVILLALLALGCPLLVAPAPALADHGQVSILESDPLLLASPGATLSTIKELGISTIRLSIRWQSVAPDTNSFHAPRHFNAGSPSAYPARRWAPYDAVIQAAAQAGVRVDLDVTGGAPLWATGGGMPHQHGYPFHNWKPSAARFGSFVHAVGVRYSGQYSPSLGRLAPGAGDDLPRVSFWSVYNEPNFGPDVAPQALPGHGNVPSSPQQYRALLGHAWGALHATGHGSDTLLIGELAARGTLSPGKFAMTTPLVFLRSLYCLGGNYRPLRGHTAALEGCPTSSSGTRSFALRNPALFHATGLSDHPYMRWFPPNQERDQDQPKGFRQLKSGYASLATIGQLERGMNRMVGAYHSGRQLPIWITEFGYITNPPSRPTHTNPYSYPSPTTAALWDNWAEYIAWKDARIASFDQYLLQDGPGRDGQHPGFPSGLIYANGRHKPGFDAFRMPLYLPHTTASSPGQALEVWGAARPVYYANLEEPSTPESVSILFRARGSSQFVPISQVPVNSPQGYFDTRVAFPSSGTVKLSWSYPSNSLPLGGTTVFSRTEQITVR